jgi:TPR repeat protein
MADDDYPEEPMPLFLSGGDEEPRHRGFGSGGERILDRAPIGPRVFKGAIAAASAAAIALAILTIGNPLALFADAKASLPAATADQAATQNLLPPPPAATQLANAGPTPVLPSTAGARGAAPAPRVTRDDIALALRAAQQNQVQTEPSPPPAAAAAPAIAAPAIAARRLDADELSNLLKRARGLIAVGDIAPARLLLERAANAQEASAALLLAQTYDPAVLGTQDMRSITPDPAMARDWYQKAARLGSMDARQRLAQMQN